jgi:hypothetical protein
VAFIPTFSVTDHGLTPQSQSTHAQIIYDAADGPGPRPVAIRLGVVCLLLTQPHTDLDALSITSVSGSQADLRRTSLEAYPNEKILASRRNTFEPVSCSTPGGDCEREG